MIAAPPHSITRRLISANPYKWEDRRLLGWDEEGREISIEFSDENVSTVEIVPAQPGWYMLNWCEQDPHDDPFGDWRLSQVPIIAWKVTRTTTRSYADGYMDCIDCAPVPAITSDDDRPQEWRLAPDGKVYAYDYGPMPFSDWLAERKKNMQIVAAKAALTPS